ncbi:hypothetical protein MMC07_003430 [Pseudocyphellaria aurata]|nr:hypothetical protein [Pseudocyphellaria aurata]
MPALVDSRSCQNTSAASSVNQPRRMVPVIPVIPRRLEKQRTDNHVSKRSVDSGAVESVKGLPIQPPSRRRGSSIAKVSSTESENGKSERKSSCAAEDDKDFGIQRHASTPSPPSKSPTYNFVASLASQYDVPQNVQTAPIQPATFHSNPTPPIDSVLPTDSSYHGYGHLPHKDFHSQPTPPNDTTPATTEVSYPNHNHIPSSFESQPLVPSHPPPPSDYSFYQGYSYGDVQAIFPPHADSLPRRSPTQSEHNNNSHVGDDSDAYPFLYEQKNRPGSIIYPESLKSESKDTVTLAEISPLGQSHADELQRANGTWHNLGFHHPASSQSIQGSEDEHTLIEQAGAGLTNLSLARGVEYEVWRHAILVTLDQTPQLTSLNKSSLTDYLAQGFNTMEHADCRLKIFHEVRFCDIADFLLHSLLIDQSPFLRGLRKSTVTQENGIKILRIRTHDRFLTPLAIETALQFCYGRSLVKYTGTSTNICPSKSSGEVSASWMENALALAASGYLFQLEAVISRGLQIASSILNWENIEKALSFALDSGLGSEWDLDSSFPVPTESYSYQTSDDATGRVTPSSIEAVAIELNSSYREPLSSPHRGNFSCSANDLLLRCLQFIISNFPDGWELDILARPLADIDRLPRTAGSRSPLAISRLSRIQFGDHPSEQVKSGDENIKLSSLLLSLPFPLLKHILDRLDEATRSRNLDPIVGERERRRRQAIRCKSVSWAQRQEDAKNWAQAGWKESVGLENSNVCLQREWWAIDKQKEQDEKKDAIKIRHLEQQFQKAFKELSRLGGLGIIGLSVCGRQLWRKEPAKDESAAGRNEDEAAAGSDEDEDAGSDEDEASVGSDEDEAAVESDEDEAAAKSNEDEAAARSDEDKASGSDKDKAAGNDKNDAAGGNNKSKKA